MLRAGAAGAALSGLALAFMTTTDLGGVYGLIAAQFVYTAMNGLILANAVAGALSSVQQRAGAASAVVGAIQYGSGMVGSAVVGVLANGTPAPMGLVMLVAGAACLAMTILNRPVGPAQGRQQRRMALFR